MILGLAGLNGAGKGEVLRFLEARSFYPLSLSDVIREELREAGLEETRERMIETGNAIRAAMGPGGLAVRLADRIVTDRNYVVDSIRHPAEVEVLRSRTAHFQLIWVGADEAVRLERIRARARRGDPTTLDELRALEGRELGSDDPSAQQLLAVRDLADFSIENDGTLDALQEKVQSILERSYFFERPSWDEYFMAIARVVASRSNCVKRKVAAVVTRDRRIISTGYNGTPRGVRNCNEGGCPRCNAFAEGGTRLDECLCSHGEENAIIQAAYHGVSVRGGTLYQRRAVGGRLQPPLSPGRHLAGPAARGRREGAAGQPAGHLRRMRRVAELAKRGVGLLLALALTSLASEDGSAASSDASPDGLLRRGFENLYADDYVQVLELTTRGGGARPISRTLQLTRKQSTRPGKALVRFLAPYDVRRTSVLILENEGSSDDLWIYLPALRMTRRVSAAQRADSFFGTDLSYEDVEPKRTADYRVRLAPAEAGGDEGCVRVDVRALDGIESTYERMVSCIEPARGVIHWTEFYRRGDLVKRLDVDLASLRPVADRLIPFRMTMRTLRSGSETDLVTRSYDIVDEVPDTLFSTWNLEGGDARRDRSRVSGGDGSR
jgi:dCMP deaminase